LSELFQSIPIEKKTFRAPMLPHSRTGCRSKHEVLGKEAAMAKADAFDRCELKLTRYVEREARRYLEEIIPSLHSQVAEHLLLKSHKAGCGTDVKGLDWTNMVIEARTLSGVFIGFIAAHIELRDHSALINLVYTDPKYRRRGIATVLRADLEEELEHLQCTEVVAVPINRAALSWLKSAAGNHPSLEYKVHIPSDDTLDKGDRELIADSGLS